MDGRLLSSPAVRSAEGDPNSDFWRFTKISLL
jgi:hypothetical protein